MKLAVFSDTHGLTAGMVSAARRVRPDLLLHLGDYLRDAEALRREFPDIPLRAVKGNCDFASREEDTITFSAGPVTVFATHGDRYGVKHGTDSLLNAAYFAGARLVLFGHTHLPLCQNFGGLMLLNPGTAGMSPHSTFAVVEISDAGGLDCRILDLETLTPPM